MLYSDLIEPVFGYEELIRKGDVEGLPNLTILQIGHVSEFDSVVYRPVVCLVLKGAKETTIGDQSVTLQAGDALIVSHDLPVQSRIISASPDNPYLALIVSLDLTMLRSLYEQIGATAPAMTTTRSLSAGKASSAVLEPIGRYLSLMDDPVEARVLGPSILREIHFRLLMSPIGGMLRSLLSMDSHASRIARAILRIRKDFRENLSVPELAQSAGMSQSAFHEHFRQVTGTTPLQYQKDLRMIAARDLLRDGRHGVAAASFEVGYESPTHFSRDYQRKFGLAPSKEPLAALEAV